MGTASLLEDQPTLNDRAKQVAAQAAGEAARSGRRVDLPPMSDEECALVRDRLRWRPDLVARTEGAGAERHLVVIPI